MDTENCKKKHAVIRSLTTKLITKIENNLNSENATSEENIENLEQLKQKAEELKQLDNTIEISVQSEDIENEVTQSQEYQEKILICKNKIERFMKKTEHSNEPKPNYAMMSHQQRTPYESPGHLKLPLLQIPKFNVNVNHCDRGFITRITLNLVPQCHSKLRNMVNTKICMLLTATALVAFAGLSLGDPEPLPYRLRRQAVTDTPTVDMTTPGTDSVTVSRDEATLLTVISLYLGSILASIPFLQPIIIIFRFANSWMS
ncbi:hypothetical protein JTE90_002412 [Oedothorax gibbosus]|uniref:Uncharacterized protein n=1 Tax=Oedothorax gibbosus TaxID=931172 RepID=A0AAV6UU59_9ARAC|nr:hypothetical protein JTE90_002412 [Oedothorax gibbosus]